MNQKGLFYSQGSEAMI